MAEAKIGAKLPKTEDACGLHDIAPEMVAHPERLHYVVLLIDTGKTEIKHEISALGDRYTLRIPHARIRAIEPLIDASDVATAMRLMEHARGDRMGGTAPPLFTTSGLATPEDDE